ncbi:sugar phosphate nucleotidyltransferase [Streptomyces sp. NPDC059989]|uniref:sugar phosphate nucleotidyltransferase n=1 Tax=Streptomyces sp. NPDC059989 TaxID=3347026 RepID=UPI00369D34FB
MSRSQAAVPQTVVIAGGLGTRLGALTAGRPKILVPVQGHPLLDWVMAFLRDQHVTSVHLCLGHLADQVLAHLARRDYGPMRITTSVERTPVGTAGCLRLAERYLEEEFLLLLGDTYTPLDLARLTREWRGSESAAAMVVLRNRDRLVPSNVHADAGRVLRYDKSAGPGELEYVDFGIALLRKHVLRRLPAEGFLDLGVLFDSLIQGGELAALETTSRFYEIGSPAGHAELSRLAERGEIRFPGPPALARPSLPVGERSPVGDRGEEEHDRTR